jgi:hypothetical protein
MDNFKNVIPGVVRAGFRAAGAREQSGKAAEDSRDIRRVNLALLSALGISGVVALLAGLGTHAIGPILLWSIASVASGAATGFLFGIPRVARQEPPPKSTQADRKPAGQLPDARKEEGNPSAVKGAPEPALRPNTNLEEVSDWLTKIIVGLGLVHLKDLQAIVASTAANAAAAIAAQPTATHVSIATALIVGFAIEGFFGGYIYTRLFLQGAFARSDNQLLQIARSDIESVLARAPSNVSGADDQESLPSPAQVKAATEVARLASDDPRAAIEKMVELAREYEQVRISMPSGQERTRRMTDVVGRMTVIALGAETLLPRLSASAQPGDRLAAVVILKLRFNPAYSKWLADRLVEDPPFIGFQAANALLAGSRLLGGAQLETLQAAVAEASKTLQEKGWNNDPGRDRLIAQILDSTALPATAQQSQARAPA